MTDRATARLHWHTRGRADTVQTLLASGHLHPRDLETICDLLALDRVDMFHAQRRANDCAT